MATLFTKTKLYLKANSKTWDDTKVELQDDGNGAYISIWNYDGLAEPTAEQIDSYETAGNTEEANNVVISTRKTAYGPWDKQLEEIYDNGIDSWKARILQIKTDNPKS